MKKQRVYVDDLGRERCSSCGALKPQQLAVCFENEEKESEAILCVGDKRVTVRLPFGAPDETGVICEFQEVLSFEELKLVERFRTEETGWNWVTPQEWMNQQKERHA